ncbi:unnamed protein product [Mytilus coruscus]|uniref:Uncharacterized protein n=1 Tax=Mytilus coruscus TaxID=42192 RepID=A0A6J8BAW9_MYTCO|nr:unnamed protein product [Mytilus coruscus]
MEHDLKETVQAIKILVSQTKLFESSRNGRAILPFIGSMAKGLFGLATMSDVQLLANHINALNAKSRSITQALQQHSDHLSSFVKVIDKRTSNLMQGIKDNSLEIQTIAHSFQLAIVSSEQSMVNISQILITLTNNFNVLKSNLLQLQNAFQSLVEGRFSPFLIPKHDFFSHASPNSEHIKQEVPWSLFNTFSSFILLHYIQLYIYP